MSSVINATTTSGLQIQPDNSGSLQLKTNNGTTALTIDTSQNVGIGTTSPATKLEIVAGTGSGVTYTTLTLNSGLAGNVGSGSAMYLSGGASSSRATSIIGVNTGGADGSHALTFGTSSAYANPVERMRIDSSGNVLVGTTTKSSAGGGRITSNIGSANNNCFGGTYSAAGGSGVGIDLNYANTTGTGYQVYFRYNSTGVGSITSTSSATAYNTSSDYRLKENIAPMIGALNKISQLKPCTYTWKADGSDGQGFIAHELQEIVPDCVTGEKDAIDADGNPVYQGIDTSFLVATLTAAIQEQQTIINNLKARIEALEAK